VAHANRTELFVQADGRLEYAARLADILADEDDVLVALHFLGDAARNGVTISQLRHAQPPSAYTSVVRISRGGGGAALHVSVASSTIFLISASILSIAACSMPN